MANKKNPAVNALAREGGLARARTLTPEERREIAKKAATARWDRYYEGKFAEGGSVTFYLRSALEEAKDGSSVFESQVEIDAYEQVWRKVQSHTISATCPCDECVDAVLAEVRKRYLTMLAKIDRGEKLEKDESAFFRWLIGEKANRWTRIYREQCRVRLTPR